MNKNIFKVTALAIAMCLALLSCDNLLDPKPYGEQTIDATFSDFGGTVTAVNGLYNPLSSGNLYRGNNALLFVDYASDDVMTVPNSSSGYSLLDYFEHSADNAQSFDLWADLYRIIYRANITIERVPGLTLPSSQATNSAGLPFKDQFVGEAKFMRAFAYFNLVRLFGDVPLHIAPITNPEQVNTPRTPAAEVYAQIIADLTDAATLLPPVYSNSGSGNELGRPTKWAASGILADVYLTLKQYDNAMTAAKAVVDNSDRRLNTAYASNFPARGGTENSQESLFEVQFASVATTGTAPLGNNYAFIMGAPTELNGTVQSIASYRPTNNDDPDNEGGFTGGLIQEYEDGDIRKNVTFQFANAGVNLERWLTWKHHVIGTGAVGQANFPLYRLAEMLLIYAESSNEKGVLDNTGMEYLNQLRRRAFGLPLTTPDAVVDIVTGKSQVEYRDIIRSERRKELALENKRWFDLQRYGDEYATKVLKDDQKRTNFTTDKLLLPIARVELVNNPKLIQNPGYN